MKDLNSWRRVIDQIDRELLKVLSRRQEAVRAIQQLKRQQHLPARDPEREARLLASREAWASELNMDTEHVRDIFLAILSRLPEP
jgi:chorismate mutase